MHIYIINQHGNILVHKNIKTSPEALHLLKAYDFGLTPFDEKTKSEPEFEVLKECLVIFYIGMLFLACTWLSGRFLGRCGLRTLLLLIL